MMKYSSMDRYTMKKTQDQGFREYEGIITSGKLRLQSVTHGARVCQPPASLTEDISLSAFPAPSRLPLLSPHGLQAHQAAPIPH